MLKRWAAFCYFGAALAALPFACAGSGGNTPYVDAGGTAPDGDCPLSLEAISSQQISLGPGASTDLAVSLTDCQGQPPSPGLPVSFQIIGNGGGAALSAIGTTTDVAGVAQVTLTVGSSDAAFSVVASYQTLPNVTFAVLVTTTSQSVGRIAVQMSYTGTQSFNSLQALLYNNLACNTLDPAALPAALQMAAPVASLNSSPEFANLAVGSYTVAVAASSGGKVSGFGCRSNVAVSAGLTTNAAVTIEDLPPVFSGTYLLDNQLDVTGAFPPSVASVVNLLDEATDDHDLTNEGNLHGNNQFGLDPGAFLLDFLFRQICHWECQNGENFGNCSELNHSKGDIAALYLQNFQFWNGAQPYFFGLCGGLDTSLGPDSYVYTWLNDKVQTMIMSKVPTATSNILQIINDITSAMTSMKIKSKLTLTGSTSEGGAFTHLLETMQVTVHNLAGAPSTKEFRLADAGLSSLSSTGTATAKDGVLTIPKHVFQISFGKLLQYVYLKAILPALGYSSTAQMFQSWIDCTSVGNWLSEKIPLIIPSLGKTFCDAGMKAAGDYLESLIQTAVSAQATLELQGSCEAELPLGPQLRVLKLIKGKWTGAIVEGSYTGTVTGTFTGQAQ